MIHDYSMRRRKIICYIKRTTSTSPHILVFNLLKKEKFIWTLYMNDIKVLLTFTNNKKDTCGNNF